MDNERSLRRLVASWSRRATVRSEEYKWHLGGLEEGKPDYPTVAVPFWDHPLFQALDPHVRDRVLTLGWIVYNQRTIDAEQYIANPAFGLVFEGRIPGLISPTVALAMQQSMVDEHFHTMMHLSAIERTRQLRDLHGDLCFPPAITYREYEAALQAATQQWERDLLLYTYALVSEVSINAYLNVLAADPTVQSAHRTIADLHNRDERAHSRILIALTRDLYPSMTAQHRRAFFSYLPIALDSFLKQDLLAWRVILEMVGVPERDRQEILGDSRPSEGIDHLSRDYSGLRYLAEDLDIVDELGFDFSTSAPAGT